jgi:hypothetical protein
VSKCLGVTDKLYDHTSIRIHCSASPDFRAVEMTVGTRFTHRDYIFLGHNMKMGLLQYSCDSIMVLV